jgi:hypothetical protein
MALFAFLTFGVLAGSPVARAFKMHISFPPCSAATQHEFLPLTREIRNWNCRLPIADCQLEISPRRRAAKLESSLFMRFYLPAGFPPQPKVIIA